MTDPRQLLRCGTWIYLFAIAAAFVLQSSVASAQAVSAPSGYCEAGMGDGGNDNSGDSYRVETTMCYVAGDVSLQVDYSYTGDPTAFGMQYGVSPELIAYASDNNGNLQTVLADTGVGGGDLNVASIVPSGYSSGFVYVAGSFVECGNDDCSSYGSMWSDTFQISVGATATSTTLTTSGTPITYGQTATLTATVSPSNASTGNALPTGTVTFYYTFNNYLNCTDTEPIDTSSGFATATSTITSGASVGSYSVTAVYNGDATYGESASNTIVQVVSALTTPTIVWPTPVAIPYGTALSATQLNATATCNGTTIDGTFVYTPAAGTVLAIGLQTLSVTFTPYNQNYSAVTATVPLTILATQTITEISSSANPITFGGSTTFTALVDTGGTTPTGSVNFTSDGTLIGSNKVSTVTTTNLLPYSQSWDSGYWGGWYASPTSSSITAPDGSATALEVTNSSSTQDGGYFVVNVQTPSASSAVQVTGSIWLRVPSGTMPVPLWILSNYSVIAETAWNPSTITTTWQRFQITGTTLANQTVLYLQVGGIGAGKALDVWGAQLEARATAGPYVATNGASATGSGGIATLTTTSLLGGSDSIVATYRGDAYLQASDSNSILETVTQITPTLSWTTPAAITYGTALSSTQLNATATYNGTTVPGTFTYTPAAGTVLSAGAQTLSVTFTPNDQVDYVSPQPATVSLLVNKVTPTLSLTTSAPGNPVTLTATISPTGATGTVTFWVDGSSIGPATISSTIATFTTGVLTAGTHIFAASYSGDANYSVATSSAISQVVQQGLVASSVSVSLLPASTYVGNPVTANITVSDTVGSYPDGSVSCSVPGTSQSFSSVLVNGSATWQIPGLPVGNYNVNCSYSGSAAFVASTSHAQLLSQTVPTPTWTAEGAMLMPLYGQTATLLPSGNVLIAGGNYYGDGDQWETDTAEIYTAGANGTGSFSYTGSMLHDRYYHTATLLTTGPYSGQVLIVGGGSMSHNTTWREAELYAPSTSTNGIFSQSPGNPNYPHYKHTATTLQDGTILIAGGSTPCDECIPSEIYDPMTSTFSVVGTLNADRMDHTATLLQNGMVLLAGGWGDNNTILSNAELYNPQTKTFTMTGSMNAARYDHTATLLPNGMVLITGGVDGSDNVLSSAELYDPATGTFSLTGSMNTARCNAGATLLADADVLVYGGGNASGYLVTAELYNSSSGTFTMTTSMNTAQSMATTTVLNDGTILATGGWSNGAITSSAQVYSPNNVITGAINPKYVVIGLTYAPPGPNSYVSYQNSVYVGNTSTFGSSFSRGEGITVSISHDYGIKSTIGGGRFNISGNLTITGTSTTSFTQTQSSTHTVTMTGQASNNWKTFGTPDAFHPVNHDYDIVWIWLNPLLVLTVDANQPQALPVWNGYAYNMEDEANGGPQGMDVWPAPVGCLDGNFTASQCTETYNKLARTWASGDYFPNGDVPALTQTDYNQILSFDPFVQGYSIVLDSNYPATTFDGRYTQATTAPSGSTIGGSLENIPYPQASPGLGSPSDTYTTTYSNSTVDANTSDYKTTQSFSLDEKSKGTFFGASVQYNISQTGTLTWDNSSTKSITNTQTQTDTAYIQGPPCNAPYCAQTYSGIAPTQPANFDVFQDNLFGTFMFYGTN